MISETLSIQITSQLLLSFILIFSTATLLGWRSTKSLLVPYSFFLLAIPLWDYSIPTLQNATTYASSSIVTALGIPAYIQGNFISIPHGIFEVAGGCSGIRYIIIAVALGIFWTEDCRLDFKFKLSVIVAALSVGVLANWIRVTALILIGYYSEMQNPLVKDHEFFGWVIFACVMIPFFFLLQPYSAKNPAKTENKVGRAYQPAPQYKHLVYTLLALVFAPILQFSIKYPSIQYATPYLYKHKSLSPNWNLTTEVSNWELNFFEPDTAQTAIYKHIRTGEKIAVSSVFYGKEKQGVELAGYNNHIASSKLWQYQDAITNTISSNIEVSTYILEDNRKRKKLVYGFYLIGSQKVPSQLKAKLTQIRTILEPSIPKGFVAFGIDCTRTCDKQREPLRNFINSFIAQTSLVRARPNIK